MKTAFTEEYMTIAQYLLGELDEARRDAIEARYMQDAGYSQLCDEVETDLVDAYVNGALTPDQRRHFETRYLITRQRREAVESAFLLKTYRDRMARPAASRQPAVFSLRGGRSLAVAAGLAVAMTGVLAWYFRSGEGRRPADAAKQGPAPRRESAPGPAVPSAPEPAQETPPPMRAQGKRKSSPRPGGGSVVPPAPAPLASVEDVVAMVRRGTPEASVLAELERQGVRFTLTDPDRAKLREAGVGQLIIAAMERSRADSVVTVVGPRLGKGMVTSVGDHLAVSLGSEDGVKPGDRFEIVLVYFLDPVTYELLEGDRRLVKKIAELTVTSVSAGLSSGPFSGQPLSPVYGANYMARPLKK